MFTTLEYVEFNMTPSIRISEEMKRKLDAVKRDGETFDELLDRLVTTEKDTEERGGFDDDGVIEDMARAREELNDSLEQGSDRET